MSSTLVDRRILKAFYTQYVAVLLIVLVFSVSGASGIKSRKEALVAPANVAHIAPQIGAKSLRDPFSGGDGIVLRQIDELEAILETLRNHDIRAVFALEVPKTDRFAEIEVQRAVRKAAMVRDFFVLNGVPNNAVKVTVSDDSADVEGRFSVVFESMEQVNG
jgi:hypothetical protein